MGAASMVPDSLLRAGTSRNCPARPARDVAVEIVIPVRDEERDLGPSVRRLHAYLCERFPFAARITIADNGSDDGTWAVAGALDALHVFFPHTVRALEVAALVVANLIATIVRFGLYRGWVFRGQPNDQERNAR